MLLLLHRLLRLRPCNLRMLQLRLGLLLASGYLGLLRLMLSPLILHLILVVRWLLPTPLRLLRIIGAERPSLRALLMFRLWLLLVWLLLLHLLPLLLWLLLLRLVMHRFLWLQQLLLFSLRLLCQQALRRALSLPGHIHLRRKSP